MRMQRCRRHHRMIQVVSDLWLCECSAYGRLVDMKGAVQEARGLVDAAGGIEAMRRLIEAQEDNLRKERQRDRETAWQRARDAIKEGV